MITIKNYENNFFDGCSRLLDKLQEYVVGLDPLGHNFIVPGFGKSEIERYLKDYQLTDLFFKVAIDNITNNVIGLAIGHFEYLEGGIEYKGRAIFSLDELIVDNTYRGSGVGTMLMEIMETEVKEKEVNEIHIGVFGRNKSAMDFYSKKGYDIRLATLVKKLSN